MADDCARPVPGRPQLGADRCRSGSMNTQLQALTGGYVSQRFFSPA
jgi:hypothetical protein